MLGRNAECDGLMPNIGLLQPTAAGMIMGRCY